MANILTACPECLILNGKIFGVNEIVQNPPPLHEHCKCSIIPLEAIQAGLATEQGENGVDLYLKQHGVLPENYITKEQAMQLGWVSWKGNLSSVAPDKLIGGDIYRNLNGKLPTKVGRLWHEADLTFDGNCRSDARILYSNDDLIFVTYSHYENYYEID